jgi:hypothetical protein
MPPHHFLSGECFIFHHNESRKKKEKKFTAFPPFEYASQVTLRQSKRDYIICLIEAESYDCEQTCFARRLRAVRV